MSNLAPNSKWQATNLSAISDRLAPLLQEEKLEKIIQGELQGIFLCKQETVLAMYCYDNDTHALSNIMSRIDLANPLHLLGAYSQAVFLSAFWQKTPPKNIYIAGFGGGRLAMLFHHYFPDLKIDGTDVDSNVLAVAKDYFGLDQAQMESVVAKDSREDLNERQTLYDIIFLDVFVGSGEHVNHLATVEFFELCRTRMTDGGVMVANLVIIDDRMYQKIAAMQEVFKYCMIWEYNGAHVIFASDSLLDTKTLVERVSQFTNRENPNSNFLEQARMIKPCKQVSEIEPEIKPLRDANLKN